MWKRRQLRHVLAAKMPPSVRIVSASNEGGLCPEMPLYRPTSVRLPKPIASLCLFCLCLCPLSYRTSIFPSMATLLPLGKKKMLQNTSAFECCASMPINNRC